MLIFCGCGNESSAQPASSGFSYGEENPAITEELVLRIPYDYSEGSSPYTTKSKSNRYVCRLVYSSMTVLLPDYSYELDLLSDLQTEDNLVWYLYVAEGSVFPDGTEFTSYDLRYSFQQAMRDDSYFAQSLDIVGSVSIVNASCLKVTLNYANKFFPNLLTFPVISFETVNNPRYFPGRYDFSEDGTSLLSTDQSYVNEISLVAIEDPELLTYEMRMGKYDCIYVNDPNELGTTSMGATSGLQSNKLVYLGFNSSSTFTYYSDFRRAVASAIDYGYISETVYENYAEAPKSVFNAQYGGMQYVSQNSLDLMSANLILDDIGLTGRDSEDFRTNSKGKRISLDLIVCNESSVRVSTAKAISEMLAKVGIEANVRELSYSAFMLALQNYDYDMYVAEVRLDNDLDISCMITPAAYQSFDLSYINYGFPDNENLYLQWLGFLGGTASAGDFSAAFNDVMPFAPLCYAKSCVVFSRELPFSFGGTDYDMFSDIKNWSSQ